MIRRYMILPSVVLATFQAFAAAAATVALTALVSTTAVAATAPKLMPGDRIGLKFFEEDQISGSYLIDSSGTITLPIVGAITVQGLTLAEAQKVIETELGKGYYTRPVVSVKVDEFRPVYVHGYVKSPGAYPYRTGLTAVGAVVVAGGSPSAMATALSLTSDLVAAQERVDIQTVRRAELLVRVAALQSLRDDKPEILTGDIPDDVQSHRKFTELLANERRQFETDVAALANELDVLKKQQPQFAKDREAIDSEIASQTKLAELSATRYEKLDSLAKKGLSRNFVLMEPAQQEAIAQSAISRLKSARSRNDIDAAGVTLKIVEKQNLFKQKVAQQLSEARRLLSDTEIQLMHARKLLELRRQAAGYGSEPTAPQTFIIQRLVDGKQKTFQADAWTLIEPGDIVEVRNFDAGVPRDTTGVPSIDDAPQPPAPQQNGTEAEPERKKAENSTSQPAEPAVRARMPITPIPNVLKAVSCGSVCGQEV